MAAPIGREREFDALLDAAREAVGRRGSIVFLAGATGSGKSFLLNAVVGAVASSDASPRPEIVSVRCYETSAGNPLGPFGEVLRALTSRERRPDRAKRVLELVGQVAPSLVELIPVIGKLAALGVKAAAEAGVYALGGDHEAQQAERAADVTLAVQHVAEEIPLILIVDDAHWIDAPSTEVIARLADRVDGGALLMIVAYDENLVADRHTLARVRSAVASRPAVRRIRLGDFGRETIDALLRDRYGTARHQEIRTLDWSHVDLKLGAVELAADEEGRKPGGSWRVVPLVKPLAAMLKRAWIAQGRPSEGKVCPPKRDRGSGLLDVSYVQKRVHELWIELGLEPIGLHEARHTAATWLDHARVSPKVASQLMGHKTPEYQPGAAAITLRRYTHTLPGELERARDLLDVFLVERTRARSAEA